MILPAGFAGIGKALRHRNFRLYAAGAMVSLLGLWVQRLAVGWLTWELTHSGAWLGIIAFGELFPALVLGPFAGVLVDRIDYRRMMLRTQSLSMAQAAVLAGLTLGGYITIELLLVLTIVNGAVIAFNQPARLVLVSSIVDRDTLAAAIAFNSLMFNAARFIGPAIAGPIIIYAGIGEAFAFNALTFLAFLLALVLMRIDPQDDQRRVRRGVLAEIAEGYRYAAAHKGIAPLLVTVLAGAMFGRSFVELLPAFADQVFARGADGLAILSSAIGIGAVAGGIWIAGFGGVGGLTRITILNLMLAGLTLVGFAASNALWLGVLFMLASGFTNVVSAVSAQTLLQSAVMGSMRGRVLSLYGMIFRGGPAIGALALGAASDHFGLQISVGVGALACVGVWLWASRRQSRMAAALEVAPAPLAQPLVEEDERGT